MSLVWFRVPRASSDDMDTYLEHVHPLGVRWCDWPQAPAVTYAMKDGKLMADIGTLTYGNTSGLIRIYPCRGIGRAESRVLIGTAMLAFEEKPTRARGWLARRQTKHHEAGWMCSVCVEVRDEGISEMVARHQLSMRRERWLRAKPLMRGAGA